MSFNYTTGTAPNTSTSLITGWPATIACMFKLSTVANNRPLWDIAQDTTTAYHCMLNLVNAGAQGSLLDALGTTSAIQYGASNDIDGGVWIAVVGRINQTATRYDTPISSNTTVTTDKVAWGASGSNPGFRLFDRVAGGFKGNYGKFAHLAIYTGANGYLSDADVALWTGMTTDPSTIASGAMQNYWALTTNNLVDSIGGVTLSAGGATYDSTDNPSIGTTITASDAIKPKITDASAVFQFHAKTGADTVKPKITESPVTNIYLSTTDSIKPKIADIGAVGYTGLINKATTDSIKPKITDASVIGGTIYKTASEAIKPKITESTYVYTGNGSPSQKIPLKIGISL